MQNIKNLWFKFLWLFMTSTQRARLRRKNYEFLRSQVVKHHQLGFKGMTIDFNRRFDAEDIAAFKPPMYYIAKNTKQQFVIFWDGKKMTEEIGPAIQTEQAP